MYKKKLKNNLIVTQLLLLLMLLSFFPSLMMPTIQKDEAIGKKLNLIIILWIWMLRTSYLC